MIRRTPGLLFLVLCATVLLGNTCSRASRAPTLEPRPAGKRAPTPQEKRAPLYDEGLKGDWQDWGWAPRELKDGEAARVDFTKFGGWILHHGSLKERGRSLVFRFKAPKDHGDFLEVFLGDDKKHDYPHVKVQPRHRRTGDDGWEEVLISLEELNPQNLEWDRVTLRAHHSVPPGWVELDDIALMGAAPPPAQKRIAAAASAPTTEATYQVKCDAVTGKISSGIYGIAFAPRLDSKDDHQWKLGATGRRWGGNPTDRFNWRIGHAWNTASDWFFTNVNYTGDATWHWGRFFDDNKKKGVRSALTVPMLGWVAKDIKSYSFPVEKFGKQQRTSPSNPDAGNGLAPDGSPIKPGLPTLTSVPADEGYVGDWVKAIEARKRKGQAGADLYLLGNEPMLWNSTHRDVHPEPVGYDELLERTIRYGTAVRKAAPNARIAAPGLWGWPAYFHSAKDAASSFRLRPDRRRHGDEPLIPWYLKKLRAHHKKTGVKLIDALDVHFYPQTGVYNDKVDPVTAQKRVRSTRALWDPGYVDESWIGETVKLLPRLRDMIDESWPGLDLVIGEYSFGGEEHISGAIALAESLGQFGRYGVSEAYYWTYPKENSPAFWAFRAFTNYDGKGAAFGNEALAVEAPADTSLFASWADGRKKVVAVLVNPQPNQAVSASVTFDKCKELKKPRAFTLDESTDRLVESKAFADGNAAVVKLAPYSVTVLEVATTQGE